MNPYDEKKRFAAIERDKYLAKLRGQAARRESTKELRDLAIEQRAEHEAKTSQEFLKSISRRTEFRAHIKSNWLDSHKAHEEMLHKLGLLYKEKLKWHVGRTLEGATVRTAVNRKVATTDSELLKKDFGYD